MIVKALKALIRRIPLPLTKNQYYDVLTHRIINRICRPDSNCIDVGSLEGDILSMFLHAAPGGRHYAFEPIPGYFEILEQKFRGRAEVFQIALSDSSGESTFHYVRSNPSYSGIRQRTYDKPSESVEKITVKLARLDDIIPPSTAVDLIKIDVEGAELFVLRGAESILRKSHPAILFEHGKGGADSYEYGPEEMYDFLVEQHGYGIYTLQGWLKDGKPLDLPAFRKCFHTGSEYYFLAVRGS